MGRGNLAHPLCQVLTESIFERVLVLIESGYNHLLTPTKKTLAFQTDVIEKQGNGKNSIWVVNKLSIYSVVAAVDRIEVN